MDIAPTCATCDYFFMMKKTDDGTCGGCRRRAPRAVQLSEADLGGRDLAEFMPWAIWPIVDAAAWCGEHSAWERSIRVVDGDIHDD